MANYVSSLTGSQIDNVMQKIEQGVPEGYAVGEKNGVPVSSSSVYYHNNAKYYAENAAASAARAEAAVPPSTAGAVFFDRSQSLTEAQKNQVKKNISAGSTNPNLLVNWYFADGLVVNSRGVTTGDFASGSYRMDAWQTTFGTSSTGGTWTLDNSGLTITSTNGGVYFRQAVLNPTLLVGKQITTSVMLANGDVYSGSITRTSSTQQVSHGLTGFWMGFESSTMFRFGATNGTSFTVKAVKVEMGGVSTLAYDFAPSPAEEFAKSVTLNSNVNDKYANQLIAPASNPNLLDNPWFTQGARVNQRGIYTYPSVSTATYCIDRWLYNRATISVLDAGLSFAWNGVDSNSGNIQQFTSRDLRNNLLTCSAVIAGKLYSHTFYFGTSTVTYNFTVEGAQWTWQLDHSAGMQSGAASTRLVLFSTDTTARTIAKMKLEIGATSTLLLDAPPHYGETLAKCKRFYRRISVSSGAMCALGFCTNVDNKSIFFMNVANDPQMRAVPTVNFSGTVNARQAGTSTSIPITALAVRYEPPNISLNATVSSTPTMNVPYGILLGSNSYIEFSAEI